MEGDKMDDLLNSLASATRISLEDDDVSLIHPRYSQYKARTTTNQEERRRQWLLDQKEKRLDSFIVNRGIDDLDYESSDDDADMTECTNKNPTEKRRDRAECPYKNWLMMSYWLVDVPNNFASDWYYLMCPKGRRTIVVASKGSTVAYYRRGAFMMKFHSALPGGNPDSRVAYTVIDCVYNYDTQTYYILDVLIWGIPLTNCAAELRFFWLTNKFSEYPELKTVSNKNRYQFFLLRHELVDNLPQSMATHPTFENNVPEVDGVLFFQKEGLYTGGKSPLVVWLQPFMVKDILSIPVHESYFKEIPVDYLNRMETELTETEAAASN